MVALFLVMVLLAVLSQMHDFVLWIFLSTLQNPFI
jgi:hypothetical protein